MSFYDTLMGINTTTFTLVLTLFSLTFLPWLKLNKWLKVIVRVIAILAMGYFLLVGWYTQNYDGEVPYKEKQVTFSNGKFEQICNLKKLYNTDEHKYRVTSKIMSFSFDCKINRIDDHVARYLRGDKIFLKMGEVKPLDDNKTFTIINSYKTGSVGLGASFGGDGVQFMVLRDDDRTYVVSKSDLDKGEIK